MALVGGAERAMISIMKASSPAILWRGVALLEMDDNSPYILDELRSLCPVAIGPDQCKAMIGNSEIVVAWAVHDIASMLPKSGVRPKVIAVSHSQADSVWAMQMGENTTGVDLWVAVSESAKEPIPGPYRDQAVIIPNAIDPSRLRQKEKRDKVRQSWGVAPGAKVLGCFHRQSGEKDPTALARAIAHLPPEWVGVSVGSGFETEGVKDHARVTVGDRVIVLPARTDAGSVFGAFDALLVSSKYESFCLTMAEAFAFGLPVISTPVGIALDHPELVRTIPINDPGPGIVREVMELINKPFDTENRVLKAKLCASKLWMPDALGKSWTRLLSEMIQEPKPVGTQAVACVHRGCKTGCQHFICNRDHREVKVNECIPCVESERLVAIGA